MMFLSFCVMFLNEYKITSFTNNIEILLKNIPDKFPGFVGGLLIQQSSRSLAILLCLFPVTTDTLFFF